MKNIKVIIAIVITAVLCTSISVFATIQIQASQIGYSKDGVDMTVEDALDELYTKKGLGTQVSTLTTRGAIYTMQNDGYIIGTSTNGGWIAYDIYGDDNNIVYYPEGNLSKVSLYAPKGTIIYTRQDNGIYNLTVYEWK